MSLERHLFLQSLIWSFSCESRTVWETHKKSEKGHLLLKHPSSHSSHQRCSPLSSVYLFLFDFFIFLGSSKINVLILFKNGNDGRRIVNYLGNFISKVKLEKMWFLEFFLNLWFLLFLYGRVYWSAGESDFRSFYVYFLLGLKCLVAARRIEKAC